MVPLPSYYCWLAAALVSAAAAAAAAAAAPSDGDQQPLYRDAAAPVNARVSDLLARMSTAEKVAQTLNPFSDAATILARYNSTSVGGAWGERLQGRGYPSKWAAQNALQAGVINGSRHGIPVSVYVEGLHGGPGGGTIFPSPVNMGNSWNASMMKLIGAAIGREARIGGCDRVFAPELQVDTDARFGRFYESFSEDPHLTSVFGYFMTLGIQGPAAAADAYLGPESAACEAKHMAAYGNAGKDGAASEVSEATFFNKYWPPWILYANAGGRGVMPSHQLTTAFMQPSHANTFMLTGLWRGFHGMNETFISSDCGDIAQVQRAFGLANSSAQASAVALSAGVDQDLCVSSYEHGLPSALEQGLITEAQLDLAAGRILRQKFAAGLFEGSWKVDPKTVDSQLDTYRQLALESARQGIVLLTNQLSNGTAATNSAANGGAGSRRPTLPLSFANMHILVIGALADDATSHVGGYSNAGARVVTTWSAVQARCNATIGCTAELIHGASPNSFETDGIASAVDAVGRAGLVIAVVGDSDSTAGENGDTDDLDLNGAQLPLLWAITQATATSHIPVIGVLISAQPKTFGASLWSPAGLGKPNALVGELAAILSAWRPGEEGGTAVVDIITGVSNPSGRLSHTWPAKAGQVHSVVANSYHMPATSAGGSFAFKTGPLAPLFPFGWGLSFSNFSIGTVGITQPNGSATPVATTQRFLMTVPITNSGPAGRATIQVYARPSFALVGQAQPVNRLLCWSQVAVPANSHATATISCAASDLGMWDLGVGDYIVQGGHYSLTIAQYSGDPHAASAGVDVASTPTPAHGESMRDQARAYAKAHCGM